MRRINRLLVGPPGIGKTETVLQSYDHVEILLLSSSVEEDLAGLPYREDIYERRTIPPFLVRLQEAAKQGKTTCLFLDELDKARREVADTLLSLIASRRTPYGLELPEGTEIIAAANPPEFGGGDGISVPMLNRFSVQEFQVDPIKWGTWAKSKFSNPVIKDVILLFMKGDLPLLDSIGEGLTLKVASPRSITYALTVMQQHLDGQLDYDSATADICGLLPMYIAAALVDKISVKSDDLIDTAIGIVRRSGTTSEATPYRETEK